MNENCRIYYVGRFENMCFTKNALKAFTVT